MKTRELKTIATALRELGLGYEDTLEAMKGVTKDLRSTRSLWRDGDKSRLVKIGLALIACPEPIPISETLGAFVLSLGIIQNACMLAEITAYPEKVRMVSTEFTRYLLK